MPPRVARRWWVGLLVGGLIGLAWWGLQPRERVALPPEAQAPGAATRVPLAAAAFSDRPTTFGRTSARPEPAVRLDELPVLSVPGSARVADENRIESELSEAEYEAERDRARALPPEAGLAPGFAAQAIGPALGLTFNGLDIADCCGNINGRSWPPDPVLAAGPSHLLAAVNTTFAVFSKAGARLTTPVTALSLWSGTSCGTVSGMRLFDPFVGYDPAADRFLLGYVARSRTADGAPADESYLCVAVSQTGDPTGAWNRFAYNVKVTTANGDTWMDFPQAAVGRDALYVSGNFFLFTGGTSQFARVYALDKAALYANTAAAALFVDTPRDAYNFMAFTVQPAKSGAQLPAAGPAYFVSLMRYTCGGVSCPDLALFSMAPNFAGGQANWSHVSNLEVSGLAEPVSVPQAGSTGRVQANDTRLLDVHLHANTLYAVHTLGCNPGAGTVSCVRWYQVGGLGGAPALLQEGTLGGDGEYRFFPDLAVDQAGNLAIAYSYGSNAAPVGVRFTGRLAGDTAGTTAADGVFFAGEAVYDALAGYETSPYRWGDYTAMVVDPADPCQLWYVGEFAKNTAGVQPNWGTRIGALRFAGCGAAATATPTVTRSATPTVSGTPSATPTRTVTATPTGTATATVTASATVTRTPTATATTAASPTTCPPDVCRFSLFLPAIQR